MTLLTQTVEFWAAESWRKQGRFWKRIPGHWRRCENRNVCVLREWDIPRRGLGRKPSPTRSTHHVHLWPAWPRSSGHARYFNYNPSGPFSLSSVTWEKWDIVTCTPPTFSLIPTGKLSQGSKDTHPQPACEKPVRLHFYQLRASCFPEGTNRFFGEEIAVPTAVNGITSKTFKY